jgi:hypothetical protein
LVQENNYQEKQPEIIKDDDDKIQETDRNMSSRDRFPEELNWIKVNLKQLHNSYPGIIKYIKTWP